jgi:DNA-binding FrmR family transcriptional regulator
VDKETEPMSTDTVCHGLKLDPPAREDARRRLLSIRGHVEGVLRMLENEQVYCVDVLKQIKAVDGALNKVGDLILKSHLQSHVVTAHERGDEGRIVDELMEILKYR